MRRREVVDIVVEQYASSSIQAKNVCCPLQPRVKRAQHARQTTNYHAFVPIAQQHAAEAAAW